MNSMKYADKIKNKFYSFHSRGFVLITIFAVMGPQFAFAEGMRQKNNDAVHALTEDSARFKLSQLYMECEGKELLFIGTNHTFDPADPQIAGVEALYKAFEPTLVLIEGGDWPVAESKPLAIRKYSELGFTQYLAANTKTKTLSADAPLSEAIAAGLKRHSAVDTKLYFALRLVPQWTNQQNDKSVEENMAQYLASAKFNAYFPPNTQPNNLDELVQQLANRIPTLKDWKSVKANMAFDGGSQSMLKEVDFTVNTFRNNYFTEQILAGLRKGERVFIIAGSTHLAKIAPLFQRGFPAEAQ
jgi:hypothetical protein